MMDCQVLIRKGSKKLHFCLLATIIFIFAIIMRLLPLSGHGVNFDQIQILQAAHSIIDGHLTLIGPRTGPAAMFTGPLIYYLAVPLLLVFGDLSVIVILPLFIALVTGIVIVAVSQKYLGFKQALILLSLWAASPLIINLDHTLWNPNLTLLASFLVFWPLYTGKQDTFVKISLFIGSFLGYQAHFTGLLLPILATLILVWRRRFQMLTFVWLGFLISFLPTIIFDLKHGWLNFSGLLALLSNKTTFSWHHLLTNLVHNFAIIAEMAGSLLFHGTNAQTSKIIGLFLICSCLCALRHHKEVKLIYIWLLTITGSFAFYDGAKPEYYFMIAFPPLLVLWQLILNKLSTSKILVALIFVVCNSIFVNNHVQVAKTGFNVQTLYQIQTYLQKQTLKNIIYDTEFGSDFGAHYFFDQLPSSTDGKTIHVSYPNTYRWSGVHHFGDVGLWSDFRTDDCNYYFEDNYVLQFDKDCEFFFIRTTKDRNHYDDEYVLACHREVLGTAKVSYWTGKMEDEHSEYLENCLTTNCPVSKTNYWLYLELETPEATLSAAIY
ncbi:hypothetical protein IJJ08_03200 [bacterium]|nr:hypothetical protein [bacterium]